jgi:homopolymeric O-antigen transport system ATP-binding protein
MSYAIRAEGLGKRYNINRGGDAHRSLRDLIESFVRPRAGKPKIVELDSKFGTDVPHVPSRELWALKDVSFDIAEGERVAIIGANGAGKSTLLKLLSRITTPTEGRIEIHGKVSSLLEVGTGFHPDLTGKENIFLNGAILGMSSREIRRKFDQIVDFSGVGNFIDTPVRHYSSGMYVRLAFAVSAWLDPDILIVDEVLAVGDAAFQKKCAARMKELTKEGRTVLLVSHSMSSVNQMCQKALYLEKGRVVAFKAVEEATVEYQRDVVEVAETRPWQRSEFSVPDPNIEIYTERQGEVVCLGGSIETEDGVCTAYLPIERPIHVKLCYRVLKDLPFPLAPNFHFFDEVGGRVFISMPPEPASSGAGDYCVTCIVPPFELNNGRFYVNLSMSSFSEQPSVHFSARESLRFEVIEKAGVDVRRHGWERPLPGVSRPRLPWSSELLSGDGRP